MSVAAMVSTASPAPSESETPKTTWIVFGGSDAQTAIMAALGIPSNGCTDVSEKEPAASMLSCLRHNPAVSIIIHNLQWEEWIKTAVGQIRGQFPETPVLLFLEYISCEPQSTDTIIATLSDKQVALVRLCSREEIYDALERAKLMLGIPVYKLIQPVRQ